MPAAAMGSTLGSMDTNAEAGRESLRRVAAVVGLSTVAGVAIWLRAGATGQLDQGLAYALPTVVALVGLVAALAACGLALVKLFDGKPWALLSSRRPAAISALLLVTMLSIGFLLCDVMSIDQGDTAWEPSDKGWVLGWVTHFVVIGGLVVLVWWRRSRSATLVAAPIATGLLAFFLVQPGGWSSEDADFRDDSTIADGFLDVFPTTLVAAVLLGIVIVAGVAADSMNEAPGSGEAQGGTGLPA